MESLEDMGEQGEKLVVGLKEGLSMNHGPHRAFIEGVELGLLQSHGYIRVVIETLLKNIKIEGMEE